MEKEEKNIDLKDVKEKLEASGFTKREVLAMTLGAAGGILLSRLAGNANAQPPNTEQEATDCSGDCAQSCVTCRDGCSNGPTK